MSIPSGRRFVNFNAINAIINTGIPINTRTINPKVVTKSPYSTIDFSEDSVFGLITSILAQEKDAIVRCEKIVQLLLGFSERNPGITRVLVGDALVGENERLRVRVLQFFERLETQLKQILREPNLDDSARLVGSIDSGANQIMALVEGKMSQFVRTSFNKKPTEHYQEQWQALRRGLFR